MRYLTFVIVIVAIGAGLRWFVLLPAAGNDRERRLQEIHLQSQPRILVDVQGAFFAANGTYASSAAQLEAAINWEPHESTDLHITAADSAGWAGWAQVNGQEDPVRCYVHVGATESTFPDMTEGEPWCPPG